MTALLIGCGKMGTLIARSLGNNPCVDELYIVDSMIPHCYQDDQVHYLNTLTPELIHRCDCTFIATPANTHCELLEQLIREGQKKIYVEKPAVVDDAEYHRIRKIQGDCSIVTGYILRQSPPAHTLKKYLQESMAQGWDLDHCAVTYQKYLPLHAEARAQEDLGVFEEIVHIWDLLFNYLELGCEGRVLTEKQLEMDPARLDRTLSAFLSYEVKQKKYTTQLEIHSSFKEPDRKREFRFQLIHKQGQTRSLTLSVDNADQLDHLTILDSDGTVICQEDYPALSKLDHQMGEVLHYFRTHEIQNLAPFEDSHRINELMAEILQ